MASGGPDLAASSLTNGGISSESNPQQDMTASGSINRPSPSEENAGPLSVDSNGVANVPTKIEGSSDPTDRDQTEGDLANSAKEEKRMGTRKGNGSLSHRFTAP